MSDEFPEIPDMDDLTRQMEEAMAEAQKAMADLPAQMEQMGNLMNSLSGLMGELPEQMETLNTAMGSFGEAHAANVQALAGDPNWSLQAEVRVGEMLHVVVEAAFDLDKVIETWESTQENGLESLVDGLVQGAAGEEYEPGLTGQVMEQLQKGRGMAIVQDVTVLKCRIPGAPGNAAETLQLATEGNIPLAIHEGLLSFELSPMLTIRNQWERAAVPTFSPMGDEILVPLADFESGEQFSHDFSVRGQDHKVAVTLTLAPLE